MPANKADGAQEWRAALAALRLDDDASFDEAQKRIALWRALPDEAEDESEKLLRAQKIAADMTEFEQGLDALAGPLRPRHFRASGRRRCRMLA